MMPDPSLRLDPETLDRAFAPVYLARAERYLREGRVLTADFSAGQGIVVGRVRGSGNRVYQSIIHIEIQADGRPRVAGQCSCPVGYNCKHVAAVLLSLIAESGREATQTVAKPLPPEVRTWLGRVERLASSRASEDPHLILYRLRSDARHGFRRLYLKGVKVRRLQAGGFGKEQAFKVDGGSRAPFVTHEDQRIMALIKGGTHGGFDDEVWLGEETGRDVLQAVALSGRGYWESTASQALHDAGPLQGRLRWRLGDDARLRVSLEADRPGLLLLPVAPPWYLDPETGACGPLETGLGDREAGLLAMAPSIAPEAAEALEEAAKARFTGLNLPLPACPERRRVGGEAPLPCLRLLSNDRAAAGPQGYHYWAASLHLGWAHNAVLSFDYRGARVDPQSQAPLATRAEGGVLVEIERDRKAEDEALRTLLELGLKQAWNTENRPGLWLEFPDESHWPPFMQRGVPRLESAGWRLEIADDFQFKVARVGDWDLEVSGGEGGRWLELDLGVEVDGERLDLLPVLVDMLRRYRADLTPQALAAREADDVVDLRLDDGRLILLPVRRLRPILATLVELFDTERVLGGGRLRLHPLQATQLAELAEKDPDLRWRGGEAARAWGRRLRELGRLPQVAAPQGLDAALRPYQLEGLAWLQFLRDCGLGGILADDMGLGKTVQTLAHLLVEKEQGRADRPSLVVAPTSLMFNWRREAERFARSLRVLTLHGAERRGRFESIAEHDLVLTTYPLLPRDLDALRGQGFHLLVLDEAQAIKNPRSKAAEAARCLDARHRICLTGTPLENHLGELWSLMDFLMPSVLGDERRFRRLFRNPIERMGDAHRQEQLRRRVAPVLLRRTKEAVAAELPAKTEILREVTLAPDQRDLYETLRLALHEKVLAEVARKGLAQSGIIILDALLKLRQVCCDPRLVALESARKVKGSAKLELLMTLIPELLQEGRRILLFSQFTSMLDLIQGELMRTGLRERDDFVKLTGRTRNRALPVDRFQAGEVPLFLISLKAGGSGLNLTAADTVIHYDPWWNPAAERQATDRAHRIGQDKPVFVYKLLTEGTVEQRVAELQARKQALADAMLDGGGAAAGSLSADDLDLLFAPVTDT